MPRKSDLPKRAAAIWDALGQGDPALLDDVDFSHPYPSKPRAVRTNPERDDVQRPLIVYLRRHLPADSLVFAIPNLARSKVQTFALMRDGMLPGIPDLCVITRDTRGARWVGFIECKAPEGGRLSDAQRHVQAQIAALGFPVLAECRSVQAAIDWLSDQGVEIR